MSNIQVKNVPAGLHRKLKRQAARQGRPLRELVLDALRREAEREDFWRRLEQRAPVELERAAAELLEEARTSRAAWS